MLIQGLIAHKTDAGDDLGLLHGDDKHTAGIANTASDVGRIGGIEYRDIGILHGLVHLVDQAANHSVISLVGTFHIDFTPSLDGHGDGVEVDELPDGLGNGLVLDAGSDTKVLQIVKDENDVVLAGLALQVTQGITHRYVFKPMSNALCLDGHCREA